jgi:hypothetical protein
MASKNFIILILACIIAAMILFRGNCNKVEKPVVIPVKEQDAVVQKVEAKINPEVDKLKLEVNKLKEKEVKLVKSLSYLQSENRRLGGILQTVDTSTEYENITYYEDQQEAINDLVENNAQSDSVCNAVVSNLQMQVEAKEQIIVYKDTLINTYKNSLATSYVQQDILADYNKQLKKQLKKKQVTSFLWKGAALIAGIFVLQTAINN